MSDERNIFELVSRQVGSCFLVARVSNADVFDALTHRRVYKQALAVEEAVENMREGRGTHFDPELFDLFLTLRPEFVNISLDQVSSICGGDPQED